MRRPFFENFPEVMLPIFGTTFISFVVNPQRELHLTRRQNKEERKGEEGGSSERDQNQIILLSQSVSAPRRTEKTHRINPHNKNQDKNKSL